MRFLSFAFWVVLGFDVFLVFVGIKPGIIDPDFARMQAETVKVSVEGGHGSGVLVGKRLVLTAAHVAAGKSTVTVLFQDGISYTGKPVWIGVQPYDMAMILLDAPTVNEPIAPISCAPLGLGDEFFSYGNPVIFPQALAFGRVASLKLAMEDSGPLLMSDITLAPGMSGGPAFNARGEVVGLNIAILLEPLNMQIVPTHFGLIMPMSAICETGVFHG